MRKETPKGRRPPNLRSGVMMKEEVVCVFDVGGGSALGVLLLLVAYGADEALNGGGLVIPGAV